MSDTLDTVPRFILEQIGSLGYVVELAYPAGHVVRATSPSGETRTVRGQGRPLHCPR